MTSMFERGNAFLAAKFKAHLSRDVTYKRQHKSVTIAAAPDDVEVQIDESNGVRVQFVEKVFTVVAADLVIDGETILPASGDVIIDGSKTYEVGVRLGDAACYRDAGDGMQLMIYAKQTA